MFLSKKKLVFTRPSALKDLGGAIIRKSHDKKNNAKGTTDLRVAVDMLLSLIWRFPQYQHT